MKLEDDAKYTFTDTFGAFGTPAKTPSKSRRATPGLEEHSTPSKPPPQSRRAASSGLETHSTVPE
jgi:hypothetical protein